MRPIIKKLSRQSIVSAFLHYFFVTIIIICIDLPVLPWFIEGVVVSFALALPIAVLVSENDKKICSNYFIYIHNSWNNNQCCWKLF